MQCEKAIKTCKKTDLPKTLQNKLEELQRARDNQALAEASSATKPAEPEPTPSPTISTPIAQTSEQQEKGKKARRRKRRTEKKEANESTASNNRKLWQFRQMKSRVPSW